MPQEGKASTDAVVAGCVVIILSGVAGAILGGILMPDTPSGGYYGALFVVLSSLVLWCGGGLLAGLAAGAILSWKVAGWIKRRKDQGAK
jgi:hypothetical protein